MKKDVQKTKTKPKTKPISIGIMAKALSFEPRALVETELQIMNYLCDEKTAKNAFDIYRGVLGIIVSRASSLSELAKKEGEIQDMSEREIRGFIGKAKKLKKGAVGLPSMKKITNALDGLVMVGWVQRRDLAERKKAHEKAVYYLGKDVAKEMEEYLAELYPFRYGPRPEPRPIFK